MPGGVFTTKDLLISSFNLAIRALSERQRLLRTIKLFPTPRVISMTSGFHFPNNATTNGVGNWFLHFVHWNEGALFKSQLVQMHCFPPTNSWSLLLRYVRRTT